MPYFYFIVTWFIVMFSQMVITPRLTISGIYPDFIVAATVLMGLKRGWKMGLWFGFAFGLTLDFADPMTLGWVTLLVSILGLSAGLIREKIYVENSLYQLGIVMAMALAYNILERVIESMGFFVNNLADSLIDSLFISLYTALAAGAILVLLHQRYRLRDLL